MLVGTWQSYRANFSPLPLRIQAFALSDYFGKLPNPVRHSPVLRRCQLASSCFTRSLGRPTTLLNEPEMRSTIWSP